MKFEIITKDTNGRSIIHRAAFDQQHKQLGDVLNTMDNMEGDLRSKEIDLPDIYGNTALMLACIRR